jgi:ParB-like chromosome segregation protein Spo0J
MESEKSCPDRAYATVWLPVSQILTLPEYAAIFPPLAEDERAQLSHSIAQFGILTPLLLARRPQGYVVLDGHHRLEIARQSGLPYVPAIVARDAREELEFLYAGNLQRRHLTPEQRQRILAEYQAKCEEWGHTKHTGSAGEKDIWPEVLQRLTVEHGLEAFKRAVTALSTADPARYKAVCTQLRAVVAEDMEMARRLDEAQKLCTKLLRERDTLREAVEYYEQAGAAASAEHESAAVKHLQKELADKTRQLADFSQKLKAAADENARLQEDLQRAKEREENLEKCEIPLLTSQLQAVEGENAQLRGLLDTRAKTIDLLTSLLHTLQELERLLDHTVEPWPKEQCGEVLALYEQCCAVWERAKEPFALAVQGLPPGRGLFDRLFPDKRHRQPLEDYLAKQDTGRAATANGAGEPGASATGRKRRARKPAAGLMLSNLPDDLDLDETALSDEMLERTRRDLERDLGEDLDALEAELSGMDAEVDAEAEPRPDRRPRRSGGRG